MQIDKNEIGFIITTYFTHLIWNQDALEHGFEYFFNYGLWIILPHVKLWFPKQWESNDPSNSIRDTIIKN